MSRAATIEKEEVRKQKISESLCIAYANGSRGSWNKGKHYSRPNVHHAAWNKNKPGCFTPETRKKMSESASRRGHITASHSPEANQKRAETIKSSGILKERWQDAVYREKILVHLAELNQSTEHIAACSRGGQNCQAQHPEVKNLLKIGRDYCKTEEGRRRLSHSTKKQWERMGEELIRAQRQGLKEPNKIEKILVSILDPHEWRYVGNGQVVIGNLVPDLVNINGRKEVIEVFGDYWHGPERKRPFSSEEERAEVYARFGFRLLVIWEHELKKLTPEAILSKLNTWRSQCAET